MTGLFFCLASDTVQGFSFCPAAYKPRTSVYSALCIIHTIYTARTSKAFTGLYSGVSVNLTHSSAHNTVATQAVYTPHEPRWRAYHQTQYSHRYQIQPPHRTLYSSAQPPYYNKVYIRVQRCALLWINARQCNTSQTMPARRGQSSGRGAAGGAEPLTAPPYLFSGFRPIANRGQQ